MSGAILGLLVGLVVALAGPARPRVLAPDRAQVAAPAVRERPALQRARPLLCALAAIGGWVVLGGVLGLGMGLVGAALAWRALSRLESPAAVRRRREIERDLPLAVNLLGACLAAGAATSSALSTVAEAMPGAVGEELGLAQRRLHWGLDPAVVWRSLDGPLEPLGHAFARAHETGASVQQAVSGLAEDLWRESRARADARARTVEVRAAAPLGLCFLPAFVILGVVPMAVGLFSSLALFR